MGSRILEVLQWGAIFLLLAISVVQHLKLKNIVNALKDTQKSLNETREVVASHNKKIKSLTQNG